MSELTAYHEAGHAFAAVYVGARVETVSIATDPYSDGPARYGQTEVLWDQSEFDPAELAQKQVMVALAGPVAEMIHSEDPWHPALVSEWAADWKTAWAIAVAHVTGEQKRMAWLEQASVDVHRFFSRDTIWPAIAALVDNLLAHDVLGSEQVHDIVEESLRLAR